MGVGAIPEARSLKPQMVTGVSRCDFAMTKFICFEKKE